MKLVNYTGLIVAVTLHATVKDGEDEVYCDINKKFQEILVQYLSFEQIAYFKIAFDQFHGSSGSFQQLHDSYQNESEGEIRKLPYLQDVIRLLYDSCIREVRENFRTDKQFAE